MRAQSRHRRVARRHHSFLDDDIFIDENWLLEIVDCFAHRADCVGARTVIRWEGEPEASVLACENELVQSNRGGGEFEFRGAAVPGGGNMAVRRELVAEGFRFVEELGRIGTVLLSGEDTEAIRRIRAAGKRIWYCGRAVMHHRTGGQRLKASYYVRRATGSAFPMPWSIANCAENGTRSSRAWPGSPR